ncbi:FtsK/SpoIIIE family DNA translocase [Papillibacter cinnamivorans]|uniref:DNA segregation ATPase FtsK/SpoIIIE, S-DNA-T family n=1 Tax=Papillibacter cinnamivorans DSM 12816 TaxID=1122930 RepID=A0A1W1YLD8_9FIRM|nr:DNA translocase FtsK [Papillibacter cinnamivorans]SMC36997.1 DNA segregation ATPase FtsK/SpoIIIE, S-DNA-T family [Papillibacter cinnamivorans DSM 12816]
MPATKKKPAGKRGSASGRKTAPAQAPKPYRREAGAAVCLLLAIFSFLGYFGIDAIFIRFFRELLSGLFGWGFFASAPALLFAAYVLAFHRGRPVRLRVSCILLFSPVLGILLHLILASGDFSVSASLWRELWLSGVALKSGGLFSGALAVLFEVVFSRLGSLIVFFVLAAFMLICAFNLTLSGIYDSIVRRPRTPYKADEDGSFSFDLPSGKTSARGYSIDIPVDEGPHAAMTAALRPEKKSGLFNRSPGVQTPDELLKNQSEVEPVRNYTVKKYPAVSPQAAQDPAAAKKEQMKKEDVAAAAAEVAQSIENRLSAEKEAYRYPPLTLLTAPPPGSRADGTEEMRSSAVRLSEALESFGIEAKITNITRGPSVTRYEYELDKGVKLNKVTNLQDDIALSLGATGVRIAPIPDKISVVGIEVPNKLVSTVYVREVLSSQEFKNSPSKVAFALGKDIGGNCIVGDIAKLPHLLIAGTTGSGKSVCMNSLIVSLLYKSTPDEVRLIMIDPKMIELGIYNGIPHLLIPVVTDPKKAAGALQWAVVEMMKRYKLFSERNVRDIMAYNAAVAKEGGQKLPQIVVVIDELADLMLVAAKEVEESVCRIAQMARAAGMHLVIATQRPSADVITGIMKANIPSRIAFAVASSLESRIILDTMGAEKLVGRGDMLYFPLGFGKPMRVQGCMISSEDIESVVDFVKRAGQADYSEDIMRQIEQNVAQNEKGGGGTPAEPSAQDGSDPGDELYPAAVEVVLETGQASVSMLQRRLKLGYSRAARLVDQMEQRGIVGPFEGSKPRQLLINREQWQELQMGKEQMELSPRADGDRPPFDE